MCIEIKKECLAEKRNVIQRLVGCAYVLIIYPHTKLVP